MHPVILAHPLDVLVAQTFESADVRVVAQVRELDDDRVETRLHALNVHVQLFARDLREIPDVCG